MHFVISEAFLFFVHAAGPLVGSFQIHQPFFETFSCETFRLVKQIEKPEYYAVRHFLSRLPLSHFHSNRFSFSQIRHSLFSLEFRVFLFFSKVRLSQQGIFCSIFFLCFALCHFFSEKTPAAVPPQFPPKPKAAVPSRSGSAAWSSCFQSARSFDARLSQSEDVYEALAESKKGGKFLEDFASTKGRG